MKRNKTFIAIMVVVAAVISALAMQKTDLFNKQKKTGPAKSLQDDRIRVKTHTVTATKSGRRITAVGTILPNDEIEVRSEISGKIEKIYFKEGSPVKKGDALLKMNDEELQAQLLGVKSRLKLAEQEEERQRKFIGEGHVSQTEYDTAVVNLEIIKAEAQLLKAQLSKTEIRAPFSGRIGLRYVSEGSYINPSTLITTLLDNSVLKLDFSVPGKYAGEIVKGDKVKFGVQGTQKTFSAKVYAMQPRIDPSTRTITVRAVAEDSRGEVISGSLATVNISIKEKEVILVPSFALIPELKGHKVFLYKDGKAEERRVEIGPRDNEFVEITSGLAPGDMLITSGILQMRPGMRIEPEQVKAESREQGP